MSFRILFLYLFFFLLFLEPAFNSTIATCGLQALYVYFDFKISIILSWKVGKLDRQKLQIFGGKSTMSDSHEQVKRSCLGVKIFFVGMLVSLTFTCKIKRNQ